MRYSIYSLILHSLPLLFLLNSSLQATSIPIGGKDEGGNGQYAVEVIEVNKGSGEGDNQKLEKFYYGIGVSVLYDVRGYLIKEVFSGYSAEEAGILKGDLITHVDGKSIGGYNDIRGEDEKIIVLTVVRNNDIMFIAVKRVKIYTE